LNLPRDRIPTDIKRNPNTFTVGQWEGLMIQIAAAPEAQAATSVLEALAEAYATGDNPLGEHLLGQALDDDLPWDQVCAAAARGIARHRAEQTRG
jgi:hypothetical protein